MKRQRGLALAFGVLAVALLGMATSQAAPTSKVLSCGYSSNSDLVLAYGVNSVTITNPNNCNSFGFSADLNVAYGSGSTWTYSKTIGGVTTTGNYSVFNGTFQTGPIAAGDSFTMNLTSASSNWVMFYTTNLGSFNVYFNNQLEAVNPDPLVIGQEVTVTGSNLSSITSLYLEGPSNFSVTTSNRSATQLTFTMPLTYTSMMGGTSNVNAGTYKIYIGGTNTILKSVAAVAAPLTSAPGAPTIGTATALSPTSASISFSAPASNGGATIETYTATSTPGSITGRVFQSTSGSITITGLSPSTAYTFRVTASNSAGTSSASSATVSITMPANQAEIDAAALAAQKAAEAKREAERKAARIAIAKAFTESQLPDLQLFNTADIYGVTEKNYSTFTNEILKLKQSDRGDISVLELMAKKYRILDTICKGDSFITITALDLSSVGLIPKANQTTITHALRSLPTAERDDYAKISLAISDQLAIIQKRKERLVAVIALIKSHQVA
jgi:hypothetical protein